MANVLRIKRSTSTNTPASLAQGELANSETGAPNGLNELFIGAAGSVVFKLTRNLNGKPAEPTAGLANGTIDMANDYFVFEDVTDSQPYRIAISSLNLSGFNDDLTYVGSITAGNGLVNSGTASAPVLDFDFSELTDMTGSVSGTTELILQDGTTESRKAISEVALSFFDNDIQQIHGDYDFSTTTTAGDPGAGIMRFNSATPASVTALYIDDLENTGDDWGWILSNLAANDVITIRSITDPADYMVFQVSGTTDGTGYWTINGTVIHSGSLPTNGDALQLDIQWLSQGVTGVPTAITVANENSDTSCYICFFTGQTGDLGPKTVGGLWFDSSTISLHSTQFVGGGAGLTNLAAANIDSGNLGSGVLPYATASATSSAFQIPFLNTTGNASGNYGLLLDSAGGITYNPATNALTVSSLNLTVALDETDGGTGQTSYTVGDILYASTTTALSKLAATTSGYVLTANGAGVAPSWQPAQSVDGAMIYQGGYNAATNTPALDTGSPSITKGDTYVVTAAGSFFTVAVEVGDMLVALNTSSDAADVNDWTIVQQNIGAASETVAGYIEIANQSETDGGSDSSRAIVSAYLHNTTFDGGSF